MATKKKSRKKKSTKAKKTAGKKSTPAKKQARKAKPRKKPAKRAAAAKAKRKSPRRRSPKKTARPTAASVGSRETPERTRGRRAGFAPEVEDPDSGGQSGDLQGLSNVESADSESVDELLEEGNAFEAGVVSGVEDSENGGVREVRTREVPEDDVPQEYLDED